MYTPREKVFNFIKENLDAIQKDDWEGLCRIMYIKYSFSPIEVMDIFYVITSAGIHIDEKDLENSFIFWVNWMIGNAKNNDPNSTKFIKNGNELHLTKMFSSFNYHRNGWSVNKCFDTVNKNSSAIDWDISKIFP